MTTYRKEDIPSRFHYKNGKFVSPLTLVADEGWFITEVIIKYMTMYSGDDFYQTAKDTRLLSLYTSEICLHSSVVHCITSFLRESRGVARGLRQKLWRPRRSLGLACRAPDSPCFNERTLTQPPGLTE